MYYYFETWKLIYGFWSKWRGNIEIFDFFFFFSFLLPVLLGLCEDTLTNDESEIKNSHQSRFMS